MNLNHWRQRGVAVFMSLALAACGGSDGEDQAGGLQMSSPPDPVSTGNGSGSICPEAGLGIMFIAAFGRWDLCPGARPISPLPGDDDGSPPITPPGSAPPPPASRSIAVLPQDELEPNNDFALATPMQFPPRGRHDAAGIRAIGSLRDTDDTDDFILFTPPRGSTYRIYLCGESCADVLEDDTLFIAIYDQQGVMLAGTEIGVYAFQSIYIELDAGLPYYVGLHLLQSGGLARDYDLLILE